jgi:hypothetical protein
MAAIRGRWNINKRVSVRERVEREIAERYYDGQRVALEDWNDDDDRTQEQVIEILEAVGE